MENTDSVSDPAPHDEAREIIDLLAEFYEESGFGTREELMEDFGKIEKLPGSGVDLFCDLHGKALAQRSGGTYEGFGESINSYIQLILIYSALANCAEAMRPGISISRQWWWVSWAHKFYGEFIGSVSGEVWGTLASTSERAKKGAAARHKENREMKNEVFEWLDKNMGQFGSAEGAAAAIARGVAPVQHRTARTWVSQWKKARSFP